MVVVEQTTDEKSGDGEPADGIRMIENDPWTSWVEMTDRLITVRRILKKSGGEIFCYL